MRLVCEFSLKVQRALTRITKGKRNYVKATLSEVAKAIIEVFANDLILSELEHISSFADKRNKLIHADLMYKPKC